MRILFIVPYVPTHIRVRPYSLLRALINHGHQVTLATLWSNEAEREELNQWEQKGLQQIVAVQLSRLRTIQNYLKALPSKTPLQAAYRWQPQLNQQVRALLKREPFDIIHVEHLRGAQYGLALQDKGIPIIWDSVDCISHLFEQASKHSHTAFDKWLTHLELSRTRRYEGWLAHQFQHVLLTSEVDRRALTHLASIQNPKSRIQNLHVLPNGVDQTYFTPNSQPREPDTLVFSGKMSYHANVTMVLHLVQEIMPHIWAERPQVKLTIVGQNPTATVQQLGSDPRIIITGTVPDIRPYLHQAAVAVVPAVYRAGIQNKILEAMACATPIVTTGRATAALHLEPEQDLLIGNTPETFAQQVLHLLKNAHFRQTIGRYGRRYVQKAHIWSKIGEQLEDIYQVAQRH